MFTQTPIMRPIRSLAFSPNGKWLVTGSADNEGGVKDKTYVMWDTSAWTKQAPIVFQGKEEDVSVLAFSPMVNPWSLVMTTGSCRFWNFNKQKINQVISDHSQAVTSLDFSQFEDVVAHHRKPGLSLTSTIWLRHPDP